MESIEYLLNDGSRSGRFDHFMTKVVDQSADFLEGIGHFQPFYQLLIS